MVSIRGMKHVFGTRGGEHSHRAGACLLQLFGGYAVHQGFMERWQHSGGGATFAASSPSVLVQQE